MSSTLPPPATAATAATAAGPATGPAVAVTAEVEQGGDAAGAKD